MLWNYTREGINYKATKKMKEVFEQLAFIKPMLNADDPKVQWAGLWSLICTCVSVVTGAFQFLSEEIMGVNVLFTILLFVIMIADYIRISCRRNENSLERRRTD